MSTGAHMVSRPTDPASDAVAAGGESPFEIALENMRDAVALYDGDSRLVLANGRYRAMYGLPPALVRRGTPFPEVLAHCRDGGVLEADGVDVSISARSEAERSGRATVFHILMADGCTTEVHDQPLPGGGWVSTHRDVTDQLRIEARIAHLATHDALTGLLDLGAFRAEATERLAGGGRRSHVVARLNVVGFRRINETYGHAGGDALLVELAKRVRAFGPDMTLARVGSDDFAALFPAEGGPDEVVARLDGLRRAIGRPYRIGRVDVTVPIAIGYALSPEHGDQVATLLRRADAARRLVGDEGYEQVLAFDWALERERETSLMLAHDILPGIDRQEFVLAFQPIVDMATGATLGAEALLRWNHPALGFIRPDRIIGVAEEFGQITELGEWVLRAAAAAARRWPEPLTVSVNVSGMQMRSRGFGRLIRSVLKDTGLDPNRLILEVTESTVLSDRGVRTLMERIAATGVRFALDDFGTGFASLHYLLKYPFDRIKIDRSFVRGLPDRTDCQAIVQAVMTMAARLGKDVVVEGVEREEERGLLVEWGRVAGQGFMFGPPMAEADLLALAGVERIPLRRVEATQAGVAPPA
jgi:diguanylate cyclase (GGDEF)-like protein